eukprot:7343786-Lingulodinium_polyedra.AAC.1
MLGSLAASSSCELSTTTGSPPCALREAPKTCSRRAHSAASAAAPRSCGGCDRCCDASESLLMRRRCLATNDFLGLGRARWRTAASERSHAGRRSPVTALRARSRTKFSMDFT